MTALHCYYPNCQDHRSVDAELIAELIADLIADRIAEMIAELKAIYGHD